GQILTNFLDIRQLGSQGQTAENLEKVFKQICEDYGLKLDNLVGICTDGVASMDGNRSGMVTRLKQQYPGLQSFHCCAHRWHLAAEDTIKYNELNQLKKAENVLLQILHMFSTSPKNSALLAETHTLDQTEQMSIKRLCFIRWLSCFQSVKAAKHELIAIQKTLDILILQKNASALGLRSLTTKKKFITSLYIMEPVLELLSNTSKQMQKADLSFDQVEPSVLGCIRRLKALKDSNTIEQSIINE
ncbi:MAG: putative Zinc finger protein 862, partial [Streblomastix strix]